MTAELGKSPLTDLEVESLPAGWRSIGIVALIKCYDDAGEVTWSFRTSEDLSDEEIVGALTIRTELAKSSVLEMYISTE